MLDSIVAAPPCPGTEALSRGLRHDEPHPFQSHLDSCSACAREVESLRSFLALARELPPAPEGSEDVEERRAQMLALASAMPPRRSKYRRTFAFASVGIAAAAALVIVIVMAPPTASPIDRSQITTEHGPPPGSERRGIVHSEPGAMFTLVGSQPDEIVRLRGGTVLIEVSPLHVGERFRVITGDAEVEVRGTAFEVVVEADHLRAVRVRHGRVEVRRGAEPPILLGAGQRWDAEPIMVPRVVSREPNHEAGLPRVRAPSVTKPPASRPSPVATPAESAFQDGITALHAGDTPAATLAFERAIATNASGSLSEDSRFWLAVARARGGQRAGAIRAFEEFLAVHPRSVRAGKASAMLGWLLLEGRDLDGAKQRFQAALTDPAADVRASAEAGLAELPRQSP